MSIELKTHPSYRPEKVAVFFEERGWKTQFVEACSVDLVVAEPGAATECIDGRFGEREKIKKHGPKIPGGINAVAALKTGGNSVGFNSAAAEVIGLGFRAGTHKHCGFFDLWESGDLSAVRYALELPERYVDRARWVTLKARHWGGKHFHLPGQHEEKGLIFNPFLGSTVMARSDKFSYDHWFMQLLNVPSRRTMLLVAETVEKLSTYRNIEILSR